MSVDKKSAATSSRETTPSVVIGVPVISDKPDAVLGDNFGFWGAPVNDSQIGRN